MPAKPKQTKRSKSFLGPALGALTRRFAVASAALAGLVSLLNDTPAWVASLRAFLAYLSILALMRLGERWLGSRPMGQPAESKIVAPPPAPPKRGTRAA